MTRARPGTWCWGDPVGPLRELLARGGLLAIPTESSYGLAAHPASAAGVGLVYAIKGRHADQALPVVVAGFDQLAALGIDPDLPILEVLSAFWPGPLTAVLPTAISLPAAAGLGGLALRIPAHAALRGLLTELGHGLTATSANRSGEPAMTRPEEVGELLAQQAARAIIIDDGVLPGGPPSTVVAWRPKPATAGARNLATAGAGNPAEAGASGAPGAGRAAESSGTLAPAGDRASEAAGPPGAASGAVAGELVLTSTLGDLVVLRRGAVDVERLCAVWRKQ